MFPSKAEVGDRIGKKALAEESQTDCSKLALQVQEDRVLRFA